MQKNIIVIVIVLILAGGAYYIANRNQAQAPSQETQQPSQEQTQSDQGTSPTPTGQATTINSTTTVDVTPIVEGGETAAPDIQVVEIVFDGSKFTPSTVNIKVNDWVFFKNQSNTEFWPASAPHPAHTDYPELDAKMAIPAGGQYKFQFTKVGSWGFHDHLNPRAFGKINVTK